MKILRIASQTRRRRLSERGGLRAGFTLVEMLVATALTLVILLLFAGIFQQATSTMRQQRGLAQNDQRARQITNILRYDLEKMTFRQTHFGGSEGIVPLQFGDPVSAAQRGFFYISENDPALDSDDVLHFTMFIEQKVHNTDATPLVGKCEADGRPNHPDADDGGASSGVTTSRAAEVVYFLRNRKLYRRQLLLRDPIRLGSAIPDQPTHPPRAATPTYIFTGTNNDNFWRDNDLSAYRDATMDTVWLNTISSLDNSSEQDNSPLADPRRRFGFHNSTGRPIEYEQNNLFFGRFIQAETSDPDFDYPGGGVTALDRTTLGFDEDGTLANADDVVLRTAWTGGGRTNEELLLSNVDGFDVEVWDDEIGEWADLGDGSGGDFTASNPNNNAYGPAGSPGRNIFDTWHPSLRDVNAAGLGNGQPPYRPLEETTTPGAWAANTVYAAMDKVSRSVFDPRSGSGDDDPTTGAMATGYEGLYYEVVSVSGTNQSGAIEPIWPAEPGARVSDGEVVWQAKENRKGLKMIRITIRYRDSATDLPRQLSLIHSFVE